MKLTYICERCGAIIGAMNITEAEMKMLGLDPLTVDMRQDIIKSTDTEELFIYSLCDDCVDTMSLHEREWTYRGNLKLH
ncbi:MAG TPA: DUF2757 family protein [Bacillota bacterium]|nr:DUF2757 family protein [Bacillota bacterium]